MFAFVYVLICEFVKTHISMDNTHITWLAQASMAEFELNSDSIIAHLD